MEQVQGGKEIAEKKAQYVSAMGFVQFDPHDPDVEYSGRVSLSGHDAFKFRIRGVGFTGQPPVDVTLWPEFEEAFDKIQQGSFVAVEGKYNMGKSKDGSKKYHNISATRLFVDGELIVPNRSERASIENPVDDEDLPF